MTEAATTEECAMLEAQNEAMAQAIAERSQEIVKLGSRVELLTRPSVQVWRDYSSQLCIG